MVESPTLGKLTWSQKVLIHNVQDTHQETALQLSVKHSHTHTHTLRQQRTYPMLTAISLRCEIESPKPSQSSLKKALCLQKGSVHAVRQCLDLDETQ